MPLGPGQYGARAEALLRELGGDLAIVIVVGRDGPAFDVAGTPAMLTLVPGGLDPYGRPRYPRTHDGPDASRAPGP